MQREKNILRIRIYIIAISAVRTLILVLAGIRGFGVYFPRMNAGYSLTLSIVVLIIFWFIAIFYNSVRPAFIWIAFLLDGLTSYFCGLGIYRQYGTMNLYEAICFGHVLNIMIDILLIVYLIHWQYEQGKIEKGDTL